MSTSTPLRSRPRLTLPRRRRIVAQRDFDRVFAARCSVADERVVLYIHPNDAGHPRLGLSVGRRQGNAVQRNRIKRLLREAFRHEQHQLPQAMDLVVVPRGQAIGTMQEYRQSLTRLAATAAARWSRRTPKPQDE